MVDASPELEELSRFIIEAKWEDLPAPVVKEVKFLLMDAIGCALAGLTTDPGKMIVGLARRFGGPPESSIIGTGDKVSCSSAVLANGQLIGTVDYDAVMPGMHSQPYIVPPPLAIAESTGASGKDLILAMALGFEVAARFGRAWSLTTGFKGSVDFSWPERGGQAFSNFGAATGAGKLLNLDQGKMIHALGIAGHLCQVLTHVKYTYSTYRPMTKYGVAGWQNTGAITAVLLAEMGYMGDIMVLEPEHGFGKFCGYEKWNLDCMTKDLCKTWYFPKVNYKPYPCCKIFHTALDCFITIIDQNNLIPEAIESVRIFGHPAIVAPLFTSMELNNVADVQFSPPYCFALAAHRIKVGVEWQDWDTVKKPEIFEFAQKVSLQVHPKFGKELQRDPSSHLCKVEVVTKGKTFIEEKIYSRGTPGTDLGLTDEELVAKFKHNASRILTQAKIKEAIESLLELEAVGNISELMEQVTI